MHRTHAGGLLAVLWPLAGLAHPLLGLGALAGVAATRSLTAWIAAAIALGVLVPETLWLLPLAFVALAWLRHRLPPGAITDTLRARFLSWAYLLGHLRWRGSNTRLALEHAHIRSGGLALEGAPARNEWFQVVFEWGALGALALGVGAWLVWPHLGWRDPLSASLVSGAVVCSATSPLRAISRWLRGGHEGPIWGPPIRATVTLHLGVDGQVSMYGPIETADRESQKAIARALFTAGETWMRQCGIPLEEIAWTQ